MTTIDLYRDIHKAIRVELFALTTTAARIDPADAFACAALAAHVRDVATFLVEHARHEDAQIQPALEQHLPELAAKVAADHPDLESEFVAIAEHAGRADADIASLHLDLAAFTGRYLAHQDVEERVIMPALEAAIGFEAVLGIHQAIIASIPPAEMMRSLALMLPAMNVDGRAELLGGMRAGAPAEVFGGVWSLVTSVLDPTDVAAVARRLGMDAAA